MLFPIRQLLQGKESPLCIRRDARIRDALSLMLQHNFSQLPVVDENIKLTGIITEHNIISTYFHTAGAVQLLDLSVDHCQTHPTVISPDSDIFEALDLLKNEYAIVVVEDKKPIGILTAFDTTNFFRDLSDGLILVEDIEVTLRQYIQTAFPDEHSINAALMRAFGQNKRDDRRPAREYEQLSFRDHVRLILTDVNWDKFSQYLEPKELFNQLMGQVGQVRNQLAHFRGRIETIQYDALIRARDWLSNRPKPVGGKVKEIRKNDLPIHMIKESSGRYQASGISELMGKYGAFQKWLQEEKSSGETSLRIGFEEIEEILQDTLPPSAKTHRSWWTNDYSTHVQSQAWLRSGWLVDDADLEKGEITFRQSVSALYPQFFTTILDQLKQSRPGVTQVSRVFVQNWIGLSAGRTGFSFVWSLPREGVGGGALRVELAMDTGDKARNKEAFESLRTNEKEIESQIGIPLNWEKLEDRKISRVTASIPFRLATATPNEIQAAQTWGVDTMLKFIDVLTPYVKRL